MSCVVVLLCLSGMVVEHMPRIELGEVVTATLPLNEKGQAGLGVHFFVPRSDGAITVLAEARDFDVQTAVRSTTFEFLARDRNGGIGWNSRMVFAAKKGVPFFLVTARTKPGPPEEYSLRVLAGDVPLAAGIALNHAEADHYTGFGDRAMARGDKESAAISWSQSGVALFRLARFPDSRASYERSLVIARELQNARLVDYLITNLGLVCMRIGDHQSAVQYLTEHVEIARQSNNVAAEAKDHAILGDTYIALSRHDDAQRELRLAFDLFSSVGNRLDAARVEGSLGELCLAQSRLDDAKRHFQSQLDTFVDLGHAHMQAYAYERFARVADQALEHERVIEFSNRAIDIYRRVGDPAGEGRALTYLAGGLASRGSFGAAIETLRRAVALTVETGDLPGRAKHLLALASLHLQTHDISRAESAVRESLAIAQDKGLRATEAEGLRVLSTLERFRQRYREAIQLANQATALQTELGMTLELIPTLLARGESQRLLGDDQGARATFTDGLARARAAKHLRYEIDAIARLAFLEEQLGNSSKSLALYRTVLTGMDAAGSQDDVSHNAMSCRVARLELDAGRVESAIEIATRLLESRALVPLDRLSSLWVLARGHFIKGQIAEAKEVFDRATPHFESLGVFHDGDSGSSLRSSLAKWGRLGNDLTLKLASATHGADRVSVVERGFQRSGVWKGRSLLAGMIEHELGFRSRESIPIRQKIHEARCRESIVRGELARNVRELNSEASEELRNELAGIARERDRWTAKLQEVSPRDAALEMPRPLTITEVASKLSVDSMYVQFAVGDDSLSAFVVTASQSALVDLGRSTDISRDLAKYLEMIGDPNKLGTFSEVSELGSSLYKRLIAPLEKAVTRLPSRWIVVPSGHLSRFPLESLVGTRPNEASSFADLEFVVDRYEVSYVPSPAVWFHLESQSRSLRAPRALVLADPLYEPTSSAIAMRSDRKLVRLAKTRTEALSIAPLFLEEAKQGALEEVARARSCEYSAERLHLLLGKNATPLALDRDLREYTVLHFAAHGFVDGRSPEDSAIELSGNGEQGRLTLADVMDLDLDAPLVVLSACNTASGRWKYGEGVESLARAFLYAGARDVVASLWQVSDAAAAQTMSRFYRSLIQDGVPPSLALTRARRALRSQSGDVSLRGVIGLVAEPQKARRIEVGHPFFWAPFVAIGGS